MPTTSKDRPAMVLPAEAAAVAAIPDTDLAHPATVAAMRAVFVSGYTAGETAGASGDDTAAPDAAVQAIVETEFTQHAVIVATREVWSRGYTAGRAARIAGE